MPTEQLIIRRVFPVPVTFADLRRAHDAATPDIRAWYAMGACLAKYAAGIDIRAHWHAAIKESTGALDEVYAVIDGHEVRVAVIAGSGELARATVVATGARDEQINDLLIGADEANFWSNPRELLVYIHEPKMSHKTMARIAGNSFVAGSK